MICYRRTIMLRRRSLPWIWLGILCTFFYLSGLYQYLVAWSYSEYYTHWGPSHPLPPLMAQLKTGEEAKYLEKYIVTAVNEYMEDLYAGYVFRDSSPIRWVFSKWYISLDEYPYSKWPPYVTAGAYVLSRKSLEELYFGSIYTNNFRFDDIFLGMAAKKAGIKPFHHKEFYFYRKLYDKEGFKWVIACHGFDNPQELQSVWNEQRSAGNA
ncbi:hypothetical protein O3P69_002002 [Scylla paramamosain]|uniref:Hexosyltransferase n=1 Tax=Scylla paramamosain TaxID=85552 RepID=A0AAW0V7K2_SCYPA